MPTTVYTSAKVPIQLEDIPLASAGGEGTVYRVKSAGTYLNFCAKIYHPPKRTPSRKSKIEFMIRNKPQVVSSSHFIICWPSQILFDGSNNFIGFLMPLAFSGSEELYALTNPKISKRLKVLWNKFDRSTQIGIENRLKVCVNIAIAIHSIHENGKYAIVDYKPQNILITNEGNISITDVDSFQIENGSIIFHSEVATPEYAPPESIKLNPSSKLVPVSWDRFSLAVSFYEILFGIHPFAATCDGQYHMATTVGQKIQKGLFVHGSKKNYLTVIPAIHNNFKQLPTPLAQLFIKAFEDGHTNVNARPSAEQWGLVIHSELTNKTSIKANTIVTPQKKNSNPSKITYDSSSTTQKNISNTNPIVKSQVVVPKKKEDYMIWKIATVILVVICALLFFRSETKSSELSSLKKKVSDIENHNTALQNNINTLTAANRNNEAIVNQRISNLESTLSRVSEKYPITLQSAAFINVVNDTRSVEAHSFNINDVRILRPVIQYNGNTKYSSDYTVYYRIFDPENSLLSHPDSPSGFSWSGTVSSYNDFSLNNSIELGGFGDKSSSPFYTTGRYKVDFWCNGVMIGESYFDLN